MVIASTVTVLRDRWFFPLVGLCTTEGTKVVCSHPVDYKKHRKRLEKVRNLLDRDDNFETVELAEIMRFPYPMEDHYDFDHQWQQLRSDLMEMENASVDIVNLCFSRLRSCNKYSVYRVKRALTVAQILLELQLDFSTIVASIFANIPTRTTISNSSLGKNSKVIVDSMFVSLGLIWSFLGRCEAEPSKMVEELYSCTSEKRGLVCSLVVFLVDLSYTKNHENSLLHVSRSLARVALNVLAPVANRLGIWTLQLELEELSFQILHPMEFESLSRHVGRILQQREKVLEYVKSHTEQLLRSSSKVQRLVTKVTVHGRVKGLYSIYKKMKRGRRLKEIYDLLALRIIIEPQNRNLEEEACYKVVDNILERWNGVGTRWKDFIKYPKPNGYRALHTTILIHRIPLEIQIRSREMHYHAEFGSSAHFLYKLNQSHSLDKKETPKNAIIPTGTEIFFRCRSV
eukprot:jgi/Galph1/4146/GphlegSOOS_G2854.1